MVGLEIVGKHEKDKWRKIADEFVMYRTANQVRRYAREYFRHCISNHSNPNFDVKNIATPAAHNSKPAPEHLVVRNEMGNDATRQRRTS